VRKLIALLDLTRRRGAAFDGAFTPRESQTASSRPILNIPTGQQRLRQHQGMSEQDSLELLHKIANSTPEKGRLEKDGCEKAYWAEGEELGSNIGGPPETARKQHFRVEKIELTTFRL
jgi:hypothetical protein